LFAGPIIAREVLTAPRPSRYYVARAAFAGLLFILMWTAWQSLVGWREVREVGTLARFGGILFMMFSMLQLALMLFFAPLAAATAVAHEKDRRTFVLLLMTDLSDVEIVIGKLVASLLQTGTLLAAAAPVLFLNLLLGGISFGQVLDILGVTAAAGLAGGALGLVVGLWRDRTFQSLALTLLLVTLAPIVIEVAGALLPEARIFGSPLVTVLNPFRVLMAVLSPASDQLGRFRVTSMIFIGFALTLALGLLVLAVVKLRVWNPGRNEPREDREEDDAIIAVGSLVEITDAPNAAPQVAGSRPPRGEGEFSTGLNVPRRSHRRVLGAARPYRKPWANPILWRELKTRAYGRKPLIIKGAYLLAFAMGTALFVAMAAGQDEPLGQGRSIIPLALAVLSLILVNAQGVTALTSERDTGALDLLLVTELTPKEFIYGKLYGVFYNAKEMIALPLLLTLWLGLTGAMSWESVVFVVIDFLLLVHFSGMLGLHAAITYTNSRTAVAHSLGTIFFLMIGIGLCAFLIVLSNREFGRQLLSFLIFIGVGSVALYGSLGSRNPSQAIALVAILTPFWSFYCVISLVNENYLAAFLFSVGIYGFALLAMLVPAVSDFDIALGRTNAIQG
jgi:hypothetical protein